MLVSHISEKLDKVCVATMQKSFGRSVCKISGCVKHMKDTHSSPQDSVRRVFEMLHVPHFFWIAPTVFYAVVKAED